MGAIISNLDLRYDVLTGAVLVDGQLLYDVLAGAVISSLTLPYDVSQGAVQNSLNLLYAVLFAADLTLKWDAPLTHFMVAADLELAFDSLPRPTRDDRLIWDVQGPTPAFTSPIKRATKPQ